ncbi:MAG: hypothetical protein PHI24_11205 [Desulfitobacteriaceae bacterium]|nr:hypothetical protein [Desulfitobacteriaceae bacterium]
MFNPVQPLSTSDAFFIGSRKGMYGQFPEVKNITRHIMELNFGQVQEDTAMLIAEPIKRQAYCRLII